MRIFYLVLLVLITGCDSENEARLRRLSEAQSEESVRQEQEAIDVRASAMEASLKKQYSLYEGLVGTFNGPSEKATYRLKILTSINRPLYRGERIRTPAEIEEDLKNIGLNVHVLVTEGDVGISCQFENVKLDANLSEVTVIRENCPNSFRLQMDHAEIRGQMQLLTEQIAFSAQREE